jgi:hypothetical protein
VAAVLLLLLLVTSLTGFTACTYTVAPPAQPTDPVDAFIIDYGHTSGLALPRERGFVLYTYGDWRYYALGERGALNGLAALAWPTTGALGRQTYDMQPRRDAVQRALLLPEDRVLTVTVGRAEAEALRADLHAKFDERSDTRTFNPEHDLAFVRNGLGPYWMFHNSNHRTAAWLRELDCEVRGLGGWSRWTVRAP